MEIKFLRGTMHLGYAYRAGDTAKSLPDEIAKELIKSGYAIPVALKERPKKAKVETTYIRDKKR